MLGRSRLPVVAARAPALTNRAGRATFSGMRRLAGSGQLISRAALLGMVLLATASCASRHDVLLRADGSGTAEVTITLHPMLVAYTIDLAESLAGPIPEDQRAVFDLPAIRKGFAEQPGIRLISAKTPTLGTLQLELSFDDIRRVFASEAGLEEVVELTRQGNRTTVRVRITRSNFARVAAVLPFGDDPLFDSLAPSEDAGLTEAEYRDVLSFMFEDYAGETNVGEILDGTFLETRVRTEGTIVDTHGGELEDGVAVWRTPLLRGLSLEEPLVYALTFTS